MPGTYCTAPTILPHSLYSVQKCKGFLHTWPCLKEAICGNWCSDLPNIFGMFRAEWFVNPLLIRDYVHRILLLRRLITINFWKPPFKISFTFFLFQSFCCRQSSPKLTDFSQVFLVSAWNKICWAAFFSNCSAQKMSRNKYDGNHATFYLSLYLRDLSSVLSQNNVVSSMYRKLF